MCSTIAFTLLAIVVQASAQDSPVDQALNLRHLHRNDKPQRSQDHTLLAKAKDGSGVPGFAEGADGSAAPGLAQGALPWATACGRCACQEQVCKWNTLTACCQFCCDSGADDSNRGFGIVALAARTSSSPAIAALMGLAAGSSITFVAMLIMLRFRLNTTPAGYQPLVVG